MPRVPMPSDTEAFAEKTRAARISDGRGPDSCLRQAPLGVAGRFIEDHAPRRSTPLAGAQPSRLTGYARASPPSLRRTVEDTISPHTGQQGMVHSTPPQPRPRRSVSTGASPSQSQVSQ
jgi:hypothetical protein